MRGQRIADRYRLAEPVGSGGMGVVWRATDEELGRVVALKRAHVAGGGPGEQEIRREARMAAGVHHPHVVTLFDVVADGSGHWLVMEYLPSRSLADLVSQHGVLSVGQVAGIGVQMAAALRAVHAAGLVHRDVKPGNVLVAEDGTAKLADFGVSRVAWGEMTLADTPTFVGTPAFLAPEVADGDEPTQASDVFSLGATLFAAVEGRSPYGAATNPLAMVRRAAAGALVPSRRAGALAPVLAAVLRRDPAKRPDIEWVRRALAEIAGPGIDDVVPVGDQSASHQRHWPRRAGLVTGLAGALLVAGTAVLVGLPSSSTPGTATPGTARTGVDSDPALVIDDPHTVDPCGLMDSAALGRYGDTRLDVDYGGFNRCDVIVEPGGDVDGDDVEVDVRVELETEDELPEGTVERRREGKLIVTELPPNGEDCQRVIGLPAGHVVVVTADADEQPVGDTCAMADTATNTATAVLNRNGIPRRSASYSVSSLGTVDACTLLDAPALSRISGNDAARDFRDFGGWQCGWRSASSDMVAQVRFNRDNQLSVEDDGVPTRLSGKQTFVDPAGDGDQTCVIQIEHRRYVNIQREETIEVAQVFVKGPQPVSQLCSVGTDLAGSVAAKLPPA